MRKIAFLFLLLGAGVCFSEEVRYSSDPCSFAPGGSELWNAIAGRWADGGNYSDEMKPFYVFCDGKNISVFSRANVDSFEGGSGCPITVVLPGPKTIENVSKFRLVSPEVFLDTNSRYVKKVTRSNPAEDGKLNVYVDKIGNLTTRDDIGN